MFRNLGGQFLKSCNLCATFGLVRESFELEQKAVRTKKTTRSLLGGKKWAGPETTENQPKANKRRSSATGLTVPKRAFAPA